MATRETPGPQIQTKRSIVGSLLLWTLIAVLTIVSAYAFLQANYTAPAWFPVPLRGLKILDLNNALTLLIALLTLVAVRQQFIATLKPYLSYSSRPATSSEQLPAPEAGVWQVEVHNAGTGQALVTAATYRYATGGQPPGAYRSEFDAVINELEQHGWRYGENIYLQRISEGAVLGAEGSLKVFEMKFGQAGTALTALDIRIEFESRAGEQFVKEIFCIPRKGFPPFRPRPFPVAMGPPGGAPTTPPEQPGAATQAGSAPAPLAPAQSAAVSPVAHVEVSSVPAQPAEAAPAAPRVAPPAPTQPGRAAPSSPHTED